MNLIEYLNASDEFSARDIALLEQHITIEKLAKGQHFIEMGKRCSKAGFITKGIMRAYFFDGKGNEFTHCFSTKSGFVTDPIAFYNESAASQYIVAETDTQLHCFTFAAYQIFEAGITNWDKIIKQATIMAQAAKVMEKSHLLAEDASTRYLNFAKNHPEILQNVSLKSIASFLGITRYSLSRIRKNLARKA